MKIYSRSEFMKLPPGTIFSSGEPYCLSGLYVKGESWESDFLERSLIDIDAFSSEEWADRMYEMHEKGTSYPLNESYGREGMFDDEMIYLVYERNDLMRVMEILTEAIP